MAAIRMTGAARPASFVTRPVNPKTPRAFSLTEGEGPVQRHDRMVAYE